MSVVGKKTEMLMLKTNILYAYRHSGVTRTAVSCYVHLLQFTVLKQVRIRIRNVTITAHFSFLFTKI